MAGFTVAMSSATVAHLAASDPTGNAIPPLVILAIGLAGWAMRPASRKVLPRAFPKQRVGTGLRACPPQVQPNTPLQRQRLQQRADLGHIGVIAHRELPRHEIAHELALRIPNVDVLLGRNRQQAVHAGRRGVV